MADEVEVMVALHGKTDEAMVDVRLAAQVMRETGQHLEAMIGYADRLRRSLGYP